MSAIAEDCNFYLGYISKEDRMVNSDSARHCMWKWTKHDSFTC